MNLIFPCSDRLTDLNPGALGIIGRELLQRIEEIYTESGVSLPDKRVWTLGQPIVDCEQAVVSLLSLAEGQPQANMQVSRPCDVPINATFQVSVFRCVPSGGNRGNMPSPESLANFADEVAQDAYILMYLASCLDMFGADVYPADERDQFTSALGGRGFEANVEISEALGGYQGAVLTLTTVIA